MYLAQVPTTPGIHLVGIADLVAGARQGESRARRAGSRERYGARRSTRR